jgi:hypothetical protein
LPVPLLPAVIVIHAAWLTANHAQSLAAVIVRLPVPAPAVKFALPGEVE